MKGLSTLLLAVGALSVGVLIGVAFAARQRRGEHKSEPLTPDGPALEENAHWGVECTPERLRELVAEPGFYDIMRLSRIVNAMRFGQAALHFARNDDGPIGMRSRSSGFFFHGSMLFEGLQLIPQLRKAFGHQPEWERSFGVFGTDVEVLSLTAQGTVLHRIRNHVGAHVLPIVPERSLPKLDLPRFVLIRAHGPTVAAVHYELADEMALHYVLERPNSFSELLREFEAQGTQVTELLVRFMDAADVLIPHALASWNLEPQYLVSDDDG